MKAEAHPLQLSKPQQKKKLGTLVKVQWGKEDSNSKVISKTPMLAGSISQEGYTQVTIDAFNENRMHNYCANFESFFDVPKEKRSGKMERLPMNPVNSVCRFTKSTILVNGIHQKLQGTFEIDLDSLNVIRKVNDLTVNDMLVCGGLLVAAMGGAKTGNSSSGAEIQVYSLGCETQPECLFKSNALSQSTFYESFFPKSRIFASCPSKPHVAYISQANELIVLSICGDSISELSVSIPEANHVSVVGNYVKCLTSQGGLYSYSVARGHLVPQRETLLESDPGSHFTCIGSNARHSVTACVNKDTKQIGIYLVRTAKDEILDVKMYTDTKKIFPVNQIQLLRKGAFTNVIVTELYERFSVFVIKQDRLIALNEREKFVMECIYGISFYEKHKEVTSIIYGNSFFKKVSL